MKGLLLKDLYMMKQYCKYYLFCAIGFTVLSLMSADNMFFTFYPCLLCGMIPVNLMGYDERSGWMQFSETMPYTRIQLVSGKYLIGLFVQITVLIIMGSAQGIKMMITGEFAFRDYITLILLLVIVSMITSSITLPFIFKLGVEKGRTAYYVMIGFVCGASVVVSDLFSGHLGIELNSNFVLPIFAIIGVGIYAFSWYMSILFYKKREL